MDDTVNESALGEALASVHAYWLPISTCDAMIALVNRIMQRDLLAEERALIQLGELWVLAFALQRQYQMMGEYFSHSPVRAFDGVQALVTLKRLTERARFSFQRYEISASHKPDAQKLNRLSRLLALLRRACIELVEHEFGDTMERTLKLLSTRYPQSFTDIGLDYDPMASDSLQAFRPVQLQTECIFARSARLWGAPAWASSESFRRNILRTLPSLNAFTTFGLTEMLDGYVLYVPDSGGARTIAGLASIVYDILSLCSDADPVGFRCMRADLEGEDWHFQYNGADLFVSAFSSCYSPSSSRFAFDASGTLLLFQPQHSFDRHLGRTRAADQRVRDRIREAYAQAGRSYDSQLVLQPLEALRYVKPLNLGDPPVEWWRGHEQ